MKKKKAQDLVDECFEPMARAMGMWDKRQLACYVHKKKKSFPSASMSIDDNPNYLWFVIYVWASKVDDRKQFLRDMRHELLHITQIGFEGFFRSASQMVPHEKEFKLPRFHQVLSTQYNRDREHDIIRLERMMDSLGMTGKKILEIGKKMMK